VLRAGLGDASLNNATIRTSFYSTVAICTAYWTNRSSLSSPATNFSYGLPNMTLVAEGYPITGTFSDDSPFSDGACSSYWENQTTEVALASGLWPKFAVQALYYWNDDFLNSTWWSHFHIDPLTSNPDFWAAWGFYPTNSSHFRCATASGIYQVSKTFFS
jgi:hypothetical protein